MLILISFFLGSLMGLIFHPDSGILNKETSSLYIPWFRLPGDIFLNLLQMIMVPLVIASVALGVSSLSSLNELFNLGSKTMIYFVFTTFIAISIGIGLAVTIKPGSYITSPKEIKTEFISEKLSGNEKSPSIPQLIANIVPKNIIKSILDQQMLSLVLLGILLGIFFLASDQVKSAPLKSLLTSIESFCIWVVNIAMRIAPLAVFGLMCYAITQIGVSLLSGLFFYVLTVIIGLLIMYCVYLLFAYLFAKRKPRDFIIAIKEVQILGFSTSSSSSVLPISLKVAKEKLHIQHKIADFVLPLGATINMDGTALYQAVATIFIAQVYNIEFTFFQLILLLITVTGASIGTAATPGVGIVILGSILQSFNIPIEGIAIIFGVDRLLDMCRTAINLSGDLTASVIMDYHFRKVKN